MKRIFILIICLLSLSSCGKNGDSLFDSIIGIFDKECEVTFKTKDDLVGKTYTVSRGETLNKPEDPFSFEEEFIGWYTEDGYLYDFSKKVKNDFELEARYLDINLEYDSIEYILESSISVEVTCYNKFMWFKTSGKTKIGSGVIYSEKDNIYYALTNNHVIVNNEYDNTEYMVYDCYGNEYKASLYAASPDYDLAILCFEKSKELEVIKMAENDPLANEKVITTGQPNDNANTISCGKVLEYSNVDLTEKNEDSSNVKFQVIAHNAFIDSGSSGGPLFNYDLELIGINYASGKTDDDEFVAGYAILIEKVKEFVHYYKI